MAKGYLMFKPLQERCKSQEAEITRLRAALEKIIRTLGCSVNPSEELVMKIAREALAGKGE